MIIVNSVRSRVIGAFLLLLFLSFQGGRSLCYHTHIFGNRIVSHSHPFNNPDRQHTAEELISLAQIGLTSLTDELASSAVEAPSLPATDLIGCFEVSRIALGYSHLSAGRDPPVEFHTLLS